jgi:hypothetical protein
MKRCTHVMVFAILSILLIGTPGWAEETEDGESSDHSELRHHKNEFAVFLGGTDEHGHATEFTWGLDYKRRVAERWAIGGLFDYAGGGLRNSIVAASVTWYPVGKLSLMAAPGVEFHRGRGSSDGCGCAGTLKSEEPGASDKDATYFVLRLGVGWDFKIVKSYGIQPQVNLDLVNGEKVWVYGFNFTYGW